MIRQNSSEAQISQIQLNFLQKDITIEDSAAKCKSEHISSAEAFQEGFNRFG